MVDMFWSTPKIWQFPYLFLMFLSDYEPYVGFQYPEHTLLPTFLSFRPVGMVGESCLPSNAYYQWKPDYTLCFGVHTSCSEHSNLSFVYGFMRLIYGLGTMPQLLQSATLDPKYFAT